MTECKCSVDSWGCPECFSSDEECDCIEKCTCIWKYNCGENNNDNDNDNDNDEKCTCINCRCGKMSCWVCGYGEVPIDYKPCIIHDHCEAYYLDNCYENTIEIIEDKGIKKRIYNGPFDIREGVGAVCPNCAQHPNYVPLE